MPKLSLVFLEYSFLFDPDETWNNLHAFESDLAKFFNEHGTEAIVIKAVEGAPAKRILYIKKTEELQPLGLKDMPGRRGK